MLNVLVRGWLVDSDGVAVGESIDKVTAGVNSERKDAILEGSQLLLGMID